MCPAATDAMKTFSLVRSVIAASAMCLICVPGSVLADQVPNDGSGTFDSTQAALPASIHISVTEELFVPMSPNGGELSFVAVFDSDSTRMVVSVGDMRRPALAVDAADGSTQSLRLVIGPESIVNGKVRLTFDVHGDAGDSDDECTDIAPSVDISGLTVTTDGVAVDHFWPAVLTDLIVVAPSEPSVDAELAVASLVDAVAQRYAGMPVRFGVGEAADVPSHGRVIRFDATVSTPAVSGLTATLPLDQKVIRSFVGAAPASVPSTSLASVVGSSSGVASVTTIDDAAMPFTVTAAAIGGYTSGADIDIAGSLTSPRDGSAVTVSLVVNGLVVDSDEVAAADASTFHLSAAVTGRRWAPANIVSIEVLHTPSTGHCTVRRHPVTVQVDLFESSVQPVGGSREGVAAAAALAMSDGRIGVGSFGADGMGDLVEQVVALRSLDTVRTAMFVAGDEIEPGSEFDVRSVREPADVALSTRAEEAFTSKTWPWWSLLVAVFATALFVVAAGWVRRRVVRKASL